MRRNNILNITIGHFQSVVDFGLHILYRVTCLVDDIEWTPGNLTIEVDLSICPTGIGTGISIFYRVGDATILQDIYR